MIRHHRGGIDMATASRGVAESTSIRQTSLAMINDRAGEVGVMTGMLAPRRNLTPSS